MSAAAVAVIPARYAATRFPGKPLVPIAGVPMLRRVFEGARRAKRLCAVLVATDDERIASACAAFGAEVVLTSPDHATGTDRIAEAVRGRSEPIVVNVQGDEPLIEGFVIDAAVEALEADPGAPMSTVAHPADEAALDDPNRVKLVRDRRGRALYFSRAAIPHRAGPHSRARPDSRADATRDESARGLILQHVGLYAYRREFLLELVKLPRSPLEECEALEQLRALEHGAPIQVALVEGWHSVPVDVPADVARVEARLRELGRC